jgi:hypothetical protein
MLTRRNLFTMAAAAPLSGTLNRSLVLAAEAKKQIKIIGIRDRSAARPRRAL